MKDHGKYKPHVTFRSALSVIRDVPMGSLPTATVHTIFRVAQEELNMRADMLRNRATEFAEQAAKHGANSGQARVEDLTHGA